ncbi:hypothetical protein NE237_011947 [Protea cynaroides]|uniref:Uncharacterized protein n=1 Tax=Protea cynaroides TaxID=273540 RepID=A0A9Q0H0X7_9MAGN|nr:hypothetical protein NE237_011947 [Protea cynaroides]
MKKLPRPGIYCSVSMKILGGEGLKLKRNGSFFTVRANGDSQHHYNKLDSLAIVAPVQVAFGHGQESNFMRSHVPRRVDSSSVSDGPSFSILNMTADPAAAIHVTLTILFLQMLLTCQDTLDKKYREPWVTKIHVLLDEEEFGEVSTNRIYDEYSTNPVLDLGLMEGQKEPSMFFFRLPPSLPFAKRLAAAESNQITESSRKARNLCMSCNLEELPADLMGKMLVYKSGAVKLKLGDILHYVFPGSDCAFSQDVVAINTEEKHVVILDFTYSNGERIKIISLITDALDDTGKSKNGVVDLSKEWQNIRKRC